MVDATGSRRRLQALACMGWTGKAVAAVAGISRTQTQSIRRGATPTVTVAVCERLAAAYRELSSRPGPDTVCARRAQEAGWVGPIAWDGSAIDDPAAAPEQETADDPDLLMVLDGEVPEAAKGNHPLRSSYRVHLYRRAIVILRNRGYSQAEIAQQLGLSTSSVARYTDYESAVEEDVTAAPVDVDVAIPAGEDPDLHLLLAGKRVFPPHARLPRDQQERRDALFLRAVALLTERGMTAPEIGRLLHINDRSVCRYRSRLRAPVSPTPDAGQSNREAHAA